MWVGHIGIDVVRIEAEPIVGGAVGGEAIVEFGGLAAQHRFFVGAFDALFDDGGVVGQIEKARAAVRHAAKNQML